MLPRGCIVLFFCFNRRVGVCCGCVAGTSLFDLYPSLSPLLGVRYVAQAPDTRLRLEVGVKQTALPLSSRFPNVVEAPEQTLLYRRWCIWQFREDERVSSIRRESFAPVRASPSLSFLSRKAKARSKIGSRFPRLSLEARCSDRKPKKRQSIDNLVEMKMDGCDGWVFMAFVLVRRPWRLDPAQGGVVVRAFGSCVWAIGGVA